MKISDKFTFYNKGDIKIVNKIIKEKKYLVPVKLFLTMKIYYLLFLSQNIQLLFH